MSADAVRTPEERFEGLPDFAFESRYREVDGLRLAHLDEGEGRPVVFLHGEPTWSFGRGEIGARIADWLERG